MVERAATLVLTLALILGSSAWGDKSHKWNSDAAARGGVRQCRLILRISVVMKMNPLETTPYLFSRGSFGLSRRKPLEQGHERHVQ
jgi:hypothetical protein